MEALQIITRGMDENKGFYLNGILQYTFEESDGIVELTSIFISLMNEFSIGKITQYQFTDEGVDRFQEDEYTFQNHFYDYNKQEIKMVSQS